MAKEKSAAPAEEAARPMFRLKLDHDDVFFGSEPFAPGDTVGARDVILDHQPDNLPGRYRWSREHDRFEPLQKEKQKAEQGAPTLEQAFYELARAVHLPDDKGLPRLQAWCEWFEKTVEAR
jgi:hypothetical protein